MSVRTTATSAWPRWGQPALMHHQERAIGLVSQVREGATMLTARLEAPPSEDIQIPRRGASVIVQWSDEDGLHQRQATLAEQQRDHLFLIPEADVQTIQRRRFFRAPVTIDLTLLEGGTARTGRTLDLSEGGARIEVDGSPPRSTRVLASLMVDDMVFDVPGRIVRTRAERGRVELGLQFEDVPERCADVIRREVFTAQLSIRRVRR